MVVFDRPGVRRAARTALFVLIFGLINWGLGRAYVRREMARSRSGKVERQFVQSRGKVETLAAGDSHMATGFDPRLFEGSFNFALYGETYVYNYYKLKRVLKENPGIGTVLLPLDFHSFSSWRADRELRDFYWIRYVNYLEVGWLRREPLGYLAKFVRGRFFPYLGELAAPAGGSGRDSAGSVQGFVPRSATFVKNREKQAARRIRLHFSGRRVFDEVSARYFRRILELCSARGVRLALIKFPVSEPYYRRAAMRTAGSRIYERVEEMIRPFHNVDVLDFQKSFFGRDGELFDDPDHLNQAGARLLTIEIRRRLATAEIPQAAKAPAADPRPQASRAS